MGSPRRGWASWGCTPVSWPNWLRQRAGMRGVTNCDGDLDLDGGVEREHRDTDGGAGVDAGVAEGLAEQLAGAVDDTGLTGEGGVARDEPDHLDHPRHLVEVTDD